MLSLCMFVDLEKAYDCVSSYVLWELVEGLQQYMVFGLCFVQYHLCISHSSSFTSKCKAVVLSQKSSMLFSIDGREFAPGGRVSK